MNILNKIRAEGVPLVATFLALLVGLGGTLIGLGAIADPTGAIGYIDGADEIATTWGGRNAGLGVALLLAVFLRDARAYTVAWGASIFREVSDVYYGATESSFPVAFAIFLVVEIIFFVICLRASLQLISQSKSKTAEAK